MMKKKLYLVWQGADDEQFFNQYESLEDAVTSEGGKGVEVYEANLNCMGAFDAVPQKVKLKKAKKKSA